MCLTGIGEHFVVSGIRWVTAGAAIPMQSFDFNTQSDHSVI